VAWLRTASTEPGEAGEGCVLQKNQPGIQTVINKIDTIDTQFRFFHMEVLAGRPDTVAEVVRACLSLPLPLCMCVYAYW
jgi:tRNA G37 N-methylase Trm5